MRDRPLMIYRYHKYCAQYGLHRRRDIINHNATGYGRQPRVRMAANRRQAIATTSAG